MADYTSFNRMILFDWYDGPASGLVVDTRSDALYYFYLLDWDSNHRMRIFALFEVPSHVMDSLMQLTNASPKWPVWFPPEIVHPSEEVRHRIGDIKNLQLRPDTADYALLWDTKTEQPTGIWQLSEKDGQKVVPWFDAMDSDEGPLDWFGSLSVPRL
jgi:hypothetical protein